MKAFLTVCAAALCALTLRADDYVVLVGEEGWTQEKATDVVLQRGLPFSSGEAFAALMTVTMPASAEYGAVVSFGEAGVRQVTLTVASLGTGGVAYLSSGENGDANVLLSEYRLPSGTFRANEDYDIAVTYDGVQFHVYVNGAEQILTLNAGADYADGAPEVPAFIKAANLPDVCLGTRMSEVDAGSGTGSGKNDFVGATWRNAVVFARGLAADEVRLAHEDGLDALLNELYGPDVEESEDGAWLLDSVADFRWFLSEDCPADATVRLERDITLTAGAYAAKPSFSGTFDGQGHTLILAEGAKLQGTEGVGLIAATLQGATVKDLDVRVEGAILSDGTAGALAGTAENATLSDVHLTFDGTLAGDGAPHHTVSRGQSFHRVETVAGICVDTDILHPTCRIVRKPQETVAFLAIFHVRRNFDAASENRVNRRSGLCIITFGQPGDFDIHLCTCEQTGQMAAYLRCRLHHRCGRRRVDISHHLRLRPYVLLVSDFHRRENSRIYGQYNYIARQLCRLVEMQAVSFRHVKHRF